MAEVMEVTWVSERFRYALISVTGGVAAGPPAGGCAKLTAAAKMGRMSFLNMV